MAFELEFWHAADSPAGDATARDAARWDWDLRSGEVFYSARWRELVGFDETRDRSRLEAWLGRVVDADRSSLQQALSACAEGRADHLRHPHRLRRGEHAALAVVAEATVVRNGFGEPTRLTGILRPDETHEAGEVARLGALAAAANSAADSPFGNRLLDRAQLLERIAANSARLRRDAVSAPAAVMLVEIFAAANDECLIARAGMRLLQCTRLLDAVAYMGNRRFALLLENPGEPRDLLALAHRIRDSLAVAESGGEAGSRIGCRIGIALNSALSGGPLEVLHHADLALGHHGAPPAADATDTSGDVAIFDDILQRKGVAALAMEAALRTAVAEQALVLHYSPVMLPGSTRMREVHARLHWPQASGGQLDAAAFMPAALRAELLPRISTQLLEMASAQAAAMLEITGVAALIPITVEAFGPEILDAAYPARLQVALEQTELPPEALRVEVDGALALTDPEALERALRRLREIGVGLALTHFGNLPQGPTWIGRMPLDRLVLDPVTLGALGRERRSAAVAGALISLAHALGRQVLADDNGDPLREHALADLGCDLIRRPEANQPAANGEALLNALRDSPPRATARS